MTEICFVNFHDGSQRSGVEDAKMVRQHIHRAVLRDRGHRNIQSKVRHFTGAKFVTSLVKMEQQAIARRPNRDRPVRKKEHPKPLQEYFCEPSQPPSPTSLDQGNRHKISLHTLPAVPGAQISTYHPYTPHVASAVPLSVKRLDSLLKSRFFRIAAEPLFDASRADSASRVDMVFPGCFECPAFLNALLYSIVQMANRGQTTMEGLRLLGRALQNLGQCITSGSGLRHSQIGAVMILQGVAYRWNDTESHEAHTKGLIHSAQYLELNGPGLTPLGARAMFWQDLFAALLINSDRHQAHLAPAQVRWPRDVRPCLPSRLPIGFLAHRDELSEELLRCLEDIVELQATVREMEKSTVNYDLLSCMQASIESRLASKQTLCWSDSQVAECCRIAALIICFLSFTDIWANALIPCRLSEMLRACIQNCMTSLVWLGHRSLQVWLLLTGSLITILDNGYVDGFTRKWDGLLITFRSHCLLLPQAEVDEIDLDKILNGFISCQRLVQRRHSVRAWAALEQSLIMRRYELSTCAA